MLLLVVVVEMVLTFPTPWIRMILKLKARVKGVVHLGSYTSSARTATTSIATRTSHMAKTRVMRRA